MYNPIKINYDIIHANKSIFYTKEILFSDKPISKKYGLNNKTQKDFIDNELNIDGYRSDNFTNNHNGLHIIFTGCSVTFGSGLKQEEIWTKKLYNSIKNIKDCSGYYNLAFPGTGLPNQIIDIFKYCKTYGNPNYIFFAIPDFTRFYYYNKDINNIGDAFYNINDDETYKVIGLLYYQYYYMLDYFCKSNNINLISFTWEDNNLKNSFFEKTKINNFDTFYIFDNEKKEKYIFEYTQNSPNDKFAIKARDKDHFGTAYHSFWSSEIFDIIKTKMI
jgi:hypothetical protein